jgi:hypothetical protein
VKIYAFDRGSCIEAALRIGPRGNYRSSGKASADDSDENDNIFNEFMSIVCNSGRKLCSENS